MSSFFTVTKERKVHRKKYKDCKESRRVKKMKNQSKERTRIEQENDSVLLKLHLKSVFLPLLDLLASSCLPVSFSCGRRTEVELPSRPFFSFFSVKEKENKMFYDMTPTSSFSSLVSMMITDIMVGRDHKRVHFLSMSETGNKKRV